MAYETSRKRKSPSNDFIEPTKPKRNRTSNYNTDDERPSKAPKPRVDPTYGQRGAFPGLDEDGSDDALFYGPASDGLEYLRMVRSEAKTVPNLLSAKSSALDQAENIYPDRLQGYYADGAYTAAPAPAENDHPTKEIGEDEDAQEAYYTALCVRFRSLSSILQDSTPSNMISDSALCSAQELSTGGRGVWQGTLNTTPRMAVLGQLPYESVLQGLQVLESRLANGDILRENSLSLWAWGLLTRCREAGQMGSEDIGILRDLGKRAVWLMRGLRSGMEYNAKDQEQEREDDGDQLVPDGASEEVGANLGAWTGSGQEHQDADVNQSAASIPTILESPKNLCATNIERPLDAPSDLSDALAATKARILSSLPSETPATEASSIAHETILDEPKEQALKEGLRLTDASETQAQPGQLIKLHATLDMIITIVGEFYGQKDLLEGRLVWGEVDLDID